MILGFALLVFGANWFVDGASSLAAKYNVSNLTIGLTVVAFGTSAPELAVSAFASFSDHQEIVFGNVIGSNNFNLFLILGIAGLIAPLVVQSNTVWKEIPLSLLAVIIVFFMSYNVFSNEAHFLYRYEGFVLLGLFAAFMIRIYVQLKSEQNDQAQGTKQLNGVKMTVFIVAGLAALVGGGKLVVNNAIVLASDMGVSEKIIGLTIVAAGTSLPELVTSVVAVLKKNNDIAVGNVIGSNIFNIFFILAISIIIRPMPYDARFNVDLLLLAGGTMFLFVAMFTGQKKKLDRWEAAVLLVTFIMYTLYLILGEV